MVRVLITSKFREITGLKKLSNQIEDSIYDYSKEKDIFKYQDLVGIAYEFWLNEYQGNSGKELGNYFTERDLMLMTFHLLDKKDVKKYITNI